MKKTLLTVVMVMFGLSACGTDPYTGESRVSRTAIGAGTGAVLGAGVGLLTGKNAAQRKKNALIGAGIGTVAGGGVGAYMDIQDKKLREELQSTGVSVVRNGNEITLIMPGNVTFASGASDVNASFYPTLNSVAKVMKNYEKTLIDVNGYTDSTGPAQNNLTLSQKRAQSVATYLVNQGVQTERFLVNGYGATNFVATNNTEAGRQQNRRVEIKLTPLTN